MGPLPDRSWHPALRAEELPILAQSQLDRFLVLISASSRRIFQETEQLFACGVA
jgi:hypothetical protein